MNHDNRSCSPKEIASSSTTTPTTNQRVGSTSTTSSSSSTVSNNNKNQRSSGGSETQFPGKLHRMMEYAIEMGMEDVISWVHDGRAVMIHDPKKLIDTILPYYFSHTKIRSLERQLNMWHFERITYGPYKGAWIHPLFQRHDKSLCSQMSRHLSDNQWKHQPQSSYLRPLLTLPTTSTARISSSVLSRRPQPPYRRSQSSVELAHGSLATSTTSSSMTPTPIAPYNLRLDSTTSQRRQQQQKSLSDTEIEVVKPSMLSYSIHNNAHVNNNDNDLATFAGRRFHFVDNHNNGTIASSNNNNNDTHSDVQNELSSSSQILSTATTLPSRSTTRELQFQQQLPLALGSSNNNVGIRQAFGGGTPPVFDSSIINGSIMASHHNLSTTTNNSNTADTSSTSLDNILNTMMQQPNLLVGTTEAAAAGAASNILTTNSPSETELYRLSLQSLSSSNDHIHQHGNNSNTSTDNVGHNNNFNNNDLTRRSY